MLEAILLITLSGLLLSNSRKLGLLNPFQIYFFVWFSIFLFYYAFKIAFIDVRDEFLLLVLTSKAIAFVLLIIVLQKNGKKNFSGLISKKANAKESYLLIAQIVVLLSLPLAYKKAESLSGGADIFSVIGYIQLRTAMTEENQTFGLIAYLSLISYVISSIYATKYTEKKIGLTSLTISLASSLFYVYIGTGRTSALLLMALVITPLTLNGTIKIKGLIGALLITTALFLLIAGMTAKGISYEANASDNADSLLENIASYTIAPLLAFSRLIESSPPIGMGENSSRILIAIAYKLGITNIPPAALVKTYEYVPMPTNVYTVYEVYFRDFSYLGMIIPPLFLVMHFWLYKNAKLRGKEWTFYYSASIYPLLMSFFQDQYLSLMSTWIQIFFWYWIFTKSKQLKIFKIKLNRD